MYRTNQAPTLFQLALDRIYCGPQGQLFLAPILPESIAIKVRLNLIERRKLTCRNAACLFNESTTSLNLIHAYCDSISDNAQKILHVVAKRSPDLRVLLFHGKDFLTFHSHLPDDFNWLSKFQNLEVLDLSQSRADNDCIQQIGDHCKKLVALNVSYSHVTSQSLMSAKGFERLETLFIQIEDVGTSTILPFVDMRPNLKYLLHAYPLPPCRVTRPISEVKSALFSPQGNITFDIKFKFTSTHYITYRFQDVVKSDSDLGENVDLLSKLVPLKFDRELNGKITFAGIASFLRKCGESLESLKLFHIDAVDISIIMNQCPNLVHLKLNASRSFTADRSSPYPRMGFFMLESFDCNFKDLVSPLPLFRRDLAQVLKSPNLKELIFTHCDYITDSVFQEAFVCHALSKVEKMHFSHCRFITSDAFVGTFMSARCALHLLVLRQCEHFDSLENRNHFLQMAALNRWHVKVEIL